MRNLNFGYGISRPRAIDMDNNDLRKSNAIIHEMPELQVKSISPAVTAQTTRITKEETVSLPPRDLL